MDYFTKSVIDKVHGLMKSDYQLNKRNLDKLNIRERLDTLNKYATDLKNHLKDIADLKGTRARTTTDSSRIITTHEMMTDGLETG
jgi:hypothetical protein